MQVFVMDFDDWLLSSCVVLSVFNQFSLCKQLDHEAKKERKDEYIIKALRVQSYDPYHALSLYSEFSH